MKKLLTTTLLLLSLCVKSQTRIGFTEAEIRAEFYERTFKTYYTKTGMKFIYYTSNEMEVGYAFNKDGKCNLCTIQPLTQSVLNYYAERFNKDYVIINEKHWKWYNNNNIVDIMLLQEGSYSYFLFTL